MLQLVPDGSAGHGHGHSHSHDHDHAACEHGHGDECLLDVVIVGAGAAGVGCACMLTNIFGIEPSRVMLLERGDGIGTSFRNWPEEMRCMPSGARTLAATPGGRPQPLASNPKPSPSQTLGFRTCQAASPTFGRLDRRVQSSRPRSTSRAGPPPSTSTPSPTARRPRTRCTRSTRRASSTRTTSPGWRRRTSSGCSFAPR